MTTDPLTSEAGLRAPERLNVDPPPLLAATNFHDAQIETISARCGIVNSHAGSAQRRCAVLHLYPISVSSGREILVHKALPDGRRFSRNRVVPIIPHSKDPRAVLGRYQRRGRHP